MDDTLLRVYGVHAVQAMLTAHPGHVQKMVFLDVAQHAKRLKMLLNLAPKTCVVEVLSADAFEQTLAMPNATHQGVFVVMTPITHPSLQTLIANQSAPMTIVALDCVQDPHNLGACMRTSCAMGVTAIIMPKDKSAKVNETVRKVASGAAAWLPIYRVSNLSQSLKMLKKNGFWCVGSSEHAHDNIRDLSLSGVSKVVVVGNEGQGMRRLTTTLCDHLVRLPTQGPLQSLNVSVALGMILFHVQDDA